MVQDKKEDITIFNKIIAETWKLRMEAFRGLTKGIWYEITESERLRMLKNVLKLMDFEVKNRVLVEERLKVEHTEAGHTGEEVTRTGTTWRNK